MGPGIGSRPASVGSGQHSLESPTQARKSSPLNPGSQLGKSCSKELQWKGAMRGSERRRTVLMSSELELMVMWTGRLSSLRPSRVRTIALAAVIDDASM